MQSFEITDITLNPDLMGLSIGAKNTETNEKFVVAVNASMIGFARDAFGAVLGNIGLNSFMQATQGTEQAPVQQESQEAPAEENPEPEDAAE